MLTHGPRLLPKLFSTGAPRLTENNMKIAQTFTLFALIVIGLGCGYGSHSNMPPGPGTTPMIQGFIPTSAMHGTGTFTLEVDGTGFNSNATVTFNGAQMTVTSRGTGNIMISVPASAIMNAGNMPVIVTNPGMPGNQYGGGTNPAPSAPVDFPVN